MIDREQVLHVARLARLRLERRRGRGDDRRAVVGARPHRDDRRARPRRRRRPTSHVVELENVLRADEPRPSLPRERRSPSAPDSDGVGFRVPSPRRMSDLLDLTAAAGGRSESRAGELSAAELCGRLPRARRRRRARTPSSGSPRRRAGGRRRCAARRRARSPSRTSSAPRACRAPAGSKHPRGLPAAVHRDRRRSASPPPARRCSARRTWTSSRWARRTRTPPSARSRNPWDRDARPRRLLGRLGRRGRRRPRAVGARHRHRRLDPPAGRALRDRRPQADLRRVSRYGMIAFASSLDQAGPLTRDVTDAALLLQAHGRPRPARLDLDRPPRGDRAADAPSGSTGCASACRRS